MAAGAVLFVGGWVYDVLLAGSPSQDAAQQAAWDYHKTVASYIRFGALGAWQGLKLGRTAMMNCRAMRKARKITFGLRLHSLTCV